MPAPVAASTGRKAGVAINPSGVNVAATTAWTHRTLVFESAPLADVAEEFNRYNTRKIVIADPRIGSIRIGGNFRSGNTEAFLWLLQTGFPVSVDSSRDRVVLKAR